MNILLCPLCSGGVPAVCVSVLLGPGGPGPSRGPRGAGEAGGAADPGPGGAGDPGQQAAPAPAEGGPQGLPGGLLRVCVLLGRACGILGEEEGAAGEQAQLQ